MKILAIESTGLPASVAVLADDRLLGEYTVDFKKTHSQTLLPMLDALLNLLGMDVSEIDAIAISEGPGSFTGIRIGSATAKGIGLALDKPLVEVPTVDALAYNLYDTKGLVVPMMDARRSQVYTGIYRFRNHALEAVHGQYATTVRALMEELNRLGEPVTFLGDGVPVYMDEIRESLQVPFSEAPPHLSRQRAGAVAALGAKLYREGRTVTAAEHRPVYLRKSQAEREQEAKGTQIDRIEENSERLKPADYGAGDSYE